MFCVVVQDYAYDFNVIYIEIREQSRARLPTGFEMALK